MVSVRFMVCLLIHRVLGKAWGLQTTLFQFKVIVPLTWSSAHTMVLLIAYFTALHHCHTVLGWGPWKRVAGHQPTLWETKYRVLSLCPLLLRTSLGKVSTKSKVVFIRLFKLIFGRKKFYVKLPWYNNSFIAYERIRLIMSFYYAGIYSSHLEVHCWVACLLKDYI